MDFANTSGIRSPFSPRVRQSITGRRPIGLSSAKKNQGKYMQSGESQGGDVIYKTPLCTVETYGMPLPVMVTETLTFASGEVSVRMSPCGWCWLVAGRRVLAWPRDGAPGGSAAARDLTLPQTDLAHKADLVVLFYDEGAQMPSCIGVSPEGTVRYWPSVGQEGVYADVSAELAGQECERLAAQEGIRTLVLATTTCTAVLLTPGVVDGRATVICRTLRPPSGWLGGIGRRVSLLFFGSMPAHADTKLVGVVVLGEESPAGGESPEPAVSLALVAGGGGGPLLQLWKDGGLHGHSLRRPLADRQGDVSHLEVAALDVRGAPPAGLLLLVAAVNVARSPEIRYAIAHVSVEDPSNPRVTSLVPLRGGGPAAGGVGAGAGAGAAGGAGPDHEPAPRFLPLGNRALLYTHNYIALVSSTISNDKVEYIDVSMEGDRILGAELCDGVPLIFSKKHGVLVLTMADCMARTTSICDSPLGSPCPSDMYDGNLSLYEIDPHEVSMVTTDACGKLKTAFLFHVRRDQLACRALLEQLAPSPAADENDVDGLLDRTVVRIAQEILDDIPAGDPRWKQRVTGQSCSISLGSSSALQLAAQLADKNRAFTLFVDFLRATGLAARLGQVTIESEGGVVSTWWALCRLAEQLAAAMALRRLQQGEAAQIIDAAIYQVVSGSSSAESAEEPEVEAALSSGALSPADACYRRVSRIARVLRALAAARPPPGDATAAASSGAATINIVTSVLSAMHKCRSQWASISPSPSSPSPSPSPAPQQGPRALLPALVHLHKKAVSEYGHNCPDATVRAQVMEAAAALADLLLTDGALLPPAQYERMRRDLIQPHVEEGQIERAAILAEKFKDFELLIEMCVNNDDLDRLYTYVDKYINEGMCSCLFAWLCSRSGRERALLVRSVGARYPGRLSAWLSMAPAAPRPALLALHALHQGAHRPAAGQMAALAREERTSTERMCTMASMAKLCLVASEEESQCPELWNSIESCLALGELHAALPRDIRVRYGLDTDHTRVVPPDELVQMYIESDSKSLTEYDYKKALDLTDYIQDMEMRDELRLRVWCASVLRDDWSSCRVDAPAEELHDKTFFRLIDLVHVMGGDLELLLPPLEDILTARELAELVSDARVHFLIKYGYECLHDTRAQDNVEDEP